MKKTFFILWLLIFKLIPVNGQIKAVTDKGKEVILYENGTWKYAETNTPTDSEDSIRLSSKTYSRTSQSSFLVKSETIAMGIYINPNKWAFSKGDGAKEYKFNSKDDEVYAMAITEKTPIGLNYFPGIALENAKGADPNAKILHREYRIVNNKKILCLTMSAFISGIDFRYIGYYYSNKSGTIQLLCYCTEPNFTKNLEEIENFLDGLVEL